MKIVRTVREIRAVLPPSPHSAGTGLVATMGALHQGHLELIRQARAECRLVVASIFVNPAQFGDSADLVAYPRTEADDAALAADAGVHVLFAPSAGEMYPPGYATWVDVGGPALGLEGE